MIAVNELRIGNWVNCLLLGNYKLRSGDIEEDKANDIYKPILLTPEILIACGFKYMGYGWKHPDHFRPFVGYHQGFHLYWEPDHTATMVKDVMYLHQLQNIYFSLTGEELTFNPTTGTTNAGANTVTNNE